MSIILISLLLALQLCTAEFPLPQEPLPTVPQPRKLWWCMIDPELSAWMSRLPDSGSCLEPVRWNWTWRGFWLSLFEQPLVKEVSPDAPAA